MIYQNNNINKFIRDHWILILILVFSGTLSIYRIKDCQITMDEFFSINIAQRSLAEIWSLKPHPGKFYFNSSPPLYETVLHPVWLISKESLFWSRLLSASFNISALLIIFLISKLLFDKKTGLIAAALASLNYAYLFFPKMIRCYSFLNLLSLASFYIFFKLAKEKILGKKRLAFLLLVNISILYTFYFGAFIILLELALSCLFFSKKMLIKMWLCLLSSFVFLLPWGEHFLTDLSREPVIHFKISDMRHFLDAFFLRFRGGIFYDSNLLILYSVVVIYFLIIPIYLFFKKDKNKLFIGSFLVILLFSAITINYLTAEVYRGSGLFALTEPTRARYLFPFIFPIFILTGLFIRKLPRYIGEVILLIFLSFSVYTVSIYFKQPTQRFWPAQLAPIAKEAKEFRIQYPEKAIIEIEDSFFVPVFVYYFYGPSYFREACMPYTGSNLKQLNKGRYKIFFNVAGIKRLHKFESVSQLGDFNWLFLIYSNWLKDCWGKPFRQLYEEKLEQNGMENRLCLVKKESVGAFTLEIYKIK